MSLLAFPSRQRCGGTVHVFGRNGYGYEIAHESSSGSSWGSFSGPYRLAETAIAAAQQLAREVYDGCDVAICEAALREVSVGRDIPNDPCQLGGF